MENKNNKYDKNNHNKKDYNNFKNEPVVESEDFVEELVVEEPIVEIVETIEEPVSTPVVEEVKEEPVVEKEPEKTEEEKILYAINYKTKYLEAKKGKIAPIEYQEISDEIRRLKKQLEAIQLTKVKLVPVKGPLVKDRKPEKSSRYTNNMMLL